MKLARWIVAHCPPAERAARRAERAAEASGCPLMAAAAERARAAYRAGAPC